jgi:LacI family transcriptional regulator
MHRPAKTGSRPVTLRDIAERCRVSVALVSRALRGDSVNVSEANIALISQTAREMGYDPWRYQAARRLVSIGSGKDVSNYTVAFYVPPGFYNINYFHQIFSGVMDTMMPKRYGVLTVYGPLAASDELPRAIIQGDVDSVIAAVSADVLSGLLPRLRTEPSFDGRPVVSIVNHVEGASSVVADNFGGAYQAIQHLLDLGHKRFLHFHHVDAHAARIEAFNKALDDYALDPETSLIAGTWSENELEKSVDGAMKLIHRNPQCTAILAFNDISANEIAKAIMHSGLRIPEDISIVGFDDTDPLPANDAANILTTVTVPLFAMGQQAAEMAIRQRTEHITEHERMVMPVRLNIRASTAPPKR